MAFNSEPGQMRDTARAVNLSWDNPEWDTGDAPQRDNKKLFLIIGLGLLSWVATYVGMLELIEANMGDLPLIHKVIIGFSVAMLMTMVVWLLDQIFADIGWATRLLYVCGYVFLTVISVGFGFGFYWKVLESRSEASRSAESAVGQVEGSLHAAVTRLEQLQSTLDSLTAISTQKAETERQAGTSCPNSKPGDGPRRKMRDDDALRFKFASDFVKNRIGTVKTDLAGLDVDLQKIVKDDKSTIDAKTGTRNDFMRNLSRKLDMTVTGFNAFRTDPQLKQIRIDLADRSDKVTFTDTKGASYSCPDNQLTMALKGVVRAIDELPALEKPKIATVEGSEAVIEAFRRLTATFYGALSFKLPPSPEELRELQKKAVQSLDNAGVAQSRANAMAAEAGLSKRDYVPLAIALFVDLCLLLVSIGRPANRLHGLIPKMRAAERGPVIQILSRFNEIHRDRQIRENFEVFRHVVFDFHGDYYAAVPLGIPTRPPMRGEPHRVTPAELQDLHQQAHLLINLFASFEKEKIFKRVYSPLLSTSSVQKRLRRQGSKFANAEAFRVYRFRDGAWSEIILGAVMGAARRVEADQRRRGVHDLDPAFDSPAARHTPPLPDDEPLPHSLRSRGEDLRTPDFAFYDWPRREAGPTRRTKRDALHERDAHDGFNFERPETRRPANSNTAPLRPSPTGRDSTSARAMERPPAPPASAAVIPTDSPNVILHPAVVRAAEQMSEIVPPESSKPAPEPRSSYIDQPVPRDAVSVAAVRETVTWMLPVSEATLPPALLKGFAAAAAHAKASEPPHQTARVINGGALTLPSVVEHTPSMPPALMQKDASPQADDARSMAWRLRPETQD